MLVSSVFFYEMEMNVDVDECAIDDAAVCDQICRNIDGSFECACNSGYVLNEDGLTCSGVTMHSICVPAIIITIISAILTYLPSQTSTSVAPN